MQQEHKMHALNSFGCKKPRDQPKRPSGMKNSVTKVMRYERNNCFDFSIYPLTNNNAI